MRNVQIDQTSVQHQEEKRRIFHVGLFLHFTVYVIVNVILWAIWLLIPDKSSSFPAIPLIVTGAWTVILIVHALIISVSHTPAQVAHDEVKREVQKQQLK